MTRRRIVSVERIQGADAVCVRYLAHETRYVTKAQATKEPNVWAACVWWHL